MKSAASSGGRLRSHDRCSRAGTPHDVGLVARLQPEEEVLGLVPRQRQERLDAIPVREQRPDVAVFPRATAAPRSASRRRRVGAGPGSHFTPEFLTEPSRVLGTVFAGLVKLPGETPSRSAGPLDVRRDCITVFVGCAFLELRGVRASNTRDTHQTLRVRFFQRARNIRV